MYDVSPELQPLQMQDAAGNIIQLALDPSLAAQSQQHPGHYQQVHHQLQQGQGQHAHGQQQMQQMQPMQPMQQMQQMQRPPKSAKRGPDDEVPYIDDNDDRLMEMGDNCDQVRRKIHAFLNVGEMQVGEFQDALGITAQSYARFMGQNGATKGQGCDAYVAAHKFFKKRELQGIKLPRKKVKKADVAHMQEISSIQLDGEADAAVPVYDTCDEVRRKIKAYLREPGVTQAAFLREIVKTYTDDRQIQSKQLQDFLGKSGASSGNSSSAFYAAYVYFEKMRIKHEKPKSKHREVMEKIHGPAGFDRKRIRGGVLCADDKRPVEDEYGQLSLV